MIGQWSSTLGGLRPMTPSPRFLRDRRHGRCAGDSAVGHGTSSSRWCTASHVRPARCRIRHHREHDDHGEPVCAVRLDRAGLGPGARGFGQRRHAHRSGGERPRPARTHHADRPLDAPRGRGRPRGAASGGRGGGIDLALRADAFYVETESEAASNEETTTADASRVRLILEVSRAFEMSGGGVLTPGSRLGLRHDGGDA